MTRKVFRMLAATFQCCQTQHQHTPPSLHHPRCHFSGDKGRTVWTGGRHGGQGGPGWGPGSWESPSLSSGRGSTHHSLHPDMLTFVLTWLENVFPLDLICLFNHVSVLTVEVDGGHVVRHHRVRANVGVGEEVGDLVHSNIDLTNWGGVVYSCQGLSVAKWNILTGLHQPKKIESYLKERGVF